MADQIDSVKPKKRKRSMTELSLDWIAEKFRRAEKIKEELSSGTYKVESSAIAAKMVTDKELSK